MRIISSLQILRHAMTSQWLQIFAMYPIKKVQRTAISNTRFFKHIVHFPCIWQMPVISYYVDYIIDMRFSADPKQ
jgi:hypothetical protein